MAERKSFLLRIDRDTLDAVQRWANDDLRSLNAQVEFLLRRALQQNARAPKGDVPEGNVPEGNVPGTVAAKNSEPLATRPVATNPVADDISDDDNFSD